MFVDDPFTIGCDLRPIAFFVAAGEQVLMAAVTVHPPDLPIAGQESLPEFPAATFLKPTSPTHPPP